MQMSARTSFALVAGSLLLAPSLSRAQAPTAVAPPSVLPTSRALVGLVRDSAGHAIPLAEVRARGNLLVARSDDSGRFHVPLMPAGARGVFVRRLGFAPTRALITQSNGDTDSLVVILTAVATSLPSVVALEQHDSLSHAVLADFWARKAKGFGRFITRDDIEARGGMHFVDLMRAAPGVTIQNVRGRQEVRFSRNGMRDCPPQYWVDGIPIERGSADEFYPDNVEAVELYSGPATTPPRFSTRTMSCGTIVVWTRLPG
ncbi:MAG TPA: TonB-dependent receptor plug domain-containing protein [Gemmatimonadaceae bacterium]|jgi:hypothetical protein|nr:TonB-dependent receptor plug domain-containing protein [Gemmatimonadaceae bacterium]